jgi:hypothetical protein
VTYCARQQIVLLGKGRRCDECQGGHHHRVPADAELVPPDPLACVHEFQLEVIGDTLLTQHRVCRVCSHREELSADEIHAQHGYPQQYQVQEAPDAAVPSRATLEEAQRGVRTEIRRTLSLVARMKNTLRDGQSNVAAWVRVLPWGLGEAATALEFFVEALQ